MGKLPKVEELVSQMKMQGRGLAAFFNRRNGTFTTIPVDAFENHQRGVDPYSLKAADRIALAELDTILEDPDYIRLPTPIQINEHRIRMMFCESLDSEEDRKDLERILTGRENDERFKLKLYTLQLEAEWEVFSNRMYRRIIQNWCHLHSLECEE